jgi:hypothetical protein
MVEIRFIKSIIKIKDISKNDEFSSANIIISKIIMEKVLSQDFSKKKII